jgi:precorrin-6Y C5,15-methyltransferase (decarboxylating)
MDLPAPSRVFIGGCGRKLGDVITSVSRAMKYGIIVATLVRLEAPVDAMELLREIGFKTELSSISVSRAEPLGKDTFLRALNPVFILRGER